VRGNRSFWSMVMISIVAVILLQALAGSPTSPVERWLHVTHVSRWWPFVLAGTTGLIGGAVLNRGAQTPQAGQAAPAGARSDTGGKGKGGPAIRGRFAVPRHVRRERARQRRRSERLEDADRRRREEEEATARAAQPAPSGPAWMPPLVAAWLRELAGAFGWRGR